MGGHRIERVGKEDEQCFGEIGGERVAWLVPGLRVPSRCLRAIDFKVDVVGARVASDEEVDVMLGGIYASVDEVDDKPEGEGKGD